MSQPIPLEDEEVLQQLGTSRKSTHSPPPPPPRRTTTRAVAGPRHAPVTLTRGGRIIIQSRESVTPPPEPQEEPEPHETIEEAVDSVMQNVYIPGATLERGTGEFQYYLPPEEAARAAHQFLVKDYETHAQREGLSPQEWEQWEAQRQLKQLVYEEAVKRYGSASDEAVRKTLEDLAREGSLTVTSRGELRLDLRPPPQPPEEPPSLGESFIAGYTRTFKMSGGLAPSFFAPIVGRSALEQLAQKWGFGRGNPLAYIGSAEEKAEYARELQAKAPQIAAEVAGAGVGVLAGMIEAELEMLGLAKFVSAGARFHEYALNKYMQAVKEGNFAKQLGWGLAEKFTIPFKGVELVGRKIADHLTTKMVEKRVYAPSEVEINTRMWGEYAAIEWRLKGERDITKYWVMGSPAPRISNSPFLYACLLYTSPSPRD